jgi:hypothetical protein
LPPLMTGTLIISDLTNSIGPEFLFSAFVGLFEFMKFAEK